MASLAPHAEAANRFMTGFRSASVRARMPLPVVMPSITSRTALCTASWNMIAVSRE